MSCTRQTLNETICIARGNNGSVSGMDGTVNGIRDATRGINGSMSGTVRTVSGVRDTTHGVNGSMSGTVGTVSGVRDTTRGVNGSVSGYRPICANFSGSPISSANVRASTSQRISTVSPESLVRISSSTRLPAPGLQ